MEHTSSLKAVIAALLAAAALGAAGCGTASSPLPSPDPTPPATVEPTASVPAPLPTDEPSVEASLSLPPTEAPDPPESTEKPGPDLAVMPRADDAFFADAAFFGNSLVQGLSLYGGLTQGDFIAEQSAAVYNVSTTLNASLSDGTEATLLDALCEKQYGKIYILLGINELAFDPAYYARLYGELLDEIRAREPQAELYVMSLSPITVEKDADESVFTQARVLEYNAALRQVADDRGCCFVDLVDALAGEDGFLPSDHSTDGIHLTRDYYPVWADYLRTHYRG